MSVDVQTEIVIDRPVDVVAAYAADPSNAPEWYTNIDSVDWQTPPPVAVGSRMTFVARFLGRRLEYTYELVDLTPGERLTMRTAQVPFPMETTYSNRVRMSAAGESPRLRRPPPGFLHRPPPAEITMRRPYHMALGTAALAIEPAGLIARGQYARRRGRATREAPGSRTAERHHHGPAARSPG